MISVSQGTWLPNQRSFPPSEPFGSTDGFDVYIDGCRYLPDSVTISRVRTLDKGIGPDIQIKYQNLSLTVESGA